MARSQAWPNRSRRPEPGNSYVAIEFSDAQRQVAKDLPLLSTRQRPPSQLSLRHQLCTIGALNFFSPPLQL